MALASGSWWKRLKRNHTSGSRGTSLRRATAHARRTKHRCLSIDPLEDRRLLALTYSLIPLGDLSGGAFSSVSLGINNKIEVVGVGTYASSPTREHGFVFDPNTQTLTDIGALPGHSSSQAYAINENGYIVGRSGAQLFGEASSQGLGTTGFIYNPTSGQLTNLGDLPGGNTWSAAFDINASNQVIGSSGAGNGANAFVWNSTTGMTNLGDLSGGLNISLGMGINDSGVAVGAGLTGGGTGPSGSQTHAFVWDATNGIRDLSGPLAPNPNTDFISTANDINNLGIAVGQALTEEAGLIPIAWDTTEVGFPQTPLPGLPEENPGNPGQFTYSHNSSANAINEFLAVVGTSKLYYSQVNRAFLWAPERGVINLNDHLDSSGNGWTLTSAVDINDLGQIVGIGTNPSSQTEAFLLVPVNDKPVLTPIAPVYVNQGNLATFDANAIDPNGDDITYSINEDAPSGASIDPDTGVFTWTPDSTAPDQVLITVTATDDGAGFKKDTMTVAIGVRRAALFTETFEGGLGGSWTIPVASAEGQAALNNSLSVGTGSKSLQFQSTGTDLTKDLAEAIWTLNLSTVRKHNEKQTISIFGSPKPTSGTFTLQFNSINSAPIPFNATALQLQTTLAAMSSIGSGNVFVYGGQGPHNDWIVEFKGAKAGINQPLLTVANSTLNNGTVMIDETTRGGPHVMLVYHQMEGVEGFIGSGDETDVLADVHTSGTEQAKGDGVSISNNGTTWYRLRDFQGNDIQREGDGLWQLFEIDLAAEIDRINSTFGAGLTFSSSTKIKWSQYDDDPFPDDGFAIDDIKLYDNAQFFSSTLPKDVFHRVEMADPEVHYRVGLFGTVNASTPIVVSVHGAEREILGHTQYWQRFVEDPSNGVTGLVVVAPYFPEDGRYDSYGTMAWNNQNDAAADRALLDAVAEPSAASLGDDNELYLFGFSRGAHFVEGFTWARPDRVAAAVVAGADRHTFPDDATPYPYGSDVLNLVTPPPDEVTLDTQDFLEHRIMFWSGQDDLVPIDQSEYAVAQGEHRIHRTANMYSAVTAEAASLALSTNNYEHEIYIAENHAHEFFTEDIATFHEFLFRNYASGEEVPIKVYPIIVTTATSGSTVTTLPTGATSVPNSTNFFLEMWVKAPAASGVISGSVDVVYDTSLMTANLQDHGSLFNTATTGTINDAAGRVRNFGGTATVGQGTGANYALFGRVRFMTVAGLPEDNQLLMAIQDGLAPFELANTVEPRTDLLPATTTNLQRVNVAPVLAAIGNKSGFPQDTITFDANATDANIPADTLTFSLDAGFPSGASINSQTGVFTWVPGFGQVGNHSVTVRVTDNGSPAMNDFETININIQASANNAPVLNAIPSNLLLPITEGQTQLGVISATDPDMGQTLTFSLDAPVPPGASLTPVGVFTFVTDGSHGPGTYTFHVRVTDNGTPARSDTDTFQITVNGFNDNPTTSGIANVNVEINSVDTVINLWSKFADTETPDASLTYTVVENTNSGLFTSVTINPANGNLTLDYALSVVGSSSMKIRATDSGGKFIEAPFTVTVALPPNQAPVLSPIGNKVVIEGTLLTFTAMATDPDTGDLLGFSLDAGGATGDTIGLFTGIYNWTPPLGTAPASFMVTIRVEDNGIPQLNDFETITVQVVDDSNLPPVLDPIGTIADDGLQLISFDANATDPNGGQQVSFSLDAGFPTGASIHPTSGLFQWTPTDAQTPGTYMITVRATDNGLPQLSDSEVVTLNVYQPGDVDLDGDVDFQDFLILQANYGTPSGALRTEGDLDFDQDVDFQDFLILQANYGTTDTLDAGGDSMSTEALSAPLSSSATSNRAGAVESSRQLDSFFELLGDGPTSATQAAPRYTLDPFLQSDAAKPSRAARHAVRLDSAAEGIVGRSVTARRAALDEAHASGKADWLLNGLDGDWLDE